MFRDLMLECLCVMIVERYIHLNTLAGFFLADLLSSCDLDLFLIL